MSQIIRLIYQQYQNILTSSNWPNKLAADMVSLTNPNSAMFMDEDSG
jgi:hypothetical protein